jgi:hypothetical protein
MKRTVETIVTKEFEIEIADELFTPEYIKDFESGMWELDGDTLEEKYNGLFDVAAYQIANGERNFIEGLGKVQTVGWNKVCKKDFPKEAEGVTVLYEMLMDDVEVTVSK